MRKPTLTHDNTQPLLCTRCDMYSLIVLVMLALRQACPPSSSENTTQVQAPICSLTYAIQYAYRTLLHPSSSPQLRHPMLSVVEGTSGQPKLAKSTQRTQNKVKLHQPSKGMDFTGFGAWCRQQALPRRTLSAIPASTHSSVRASCK